MPEVRVVYKDDSVDTFVGRDVDFSVTENGRIMIVRYEDRLRDGIAVIAEGTWIKVARYKDKSE